MNDTPPPASIALANAILLQGFYQLWLIDNPRWQDCKMARCVYLTWIREEVPNV